MPPLFLVPPSKHRKGDNLAWNSPGSLGVYANKIMSPTGFNANSIPFVFAGVIDGPVANKSVFTQPANMKLEYTTDGSTWSTYSLSDELKKSIFLGRGSANTFFAIGGPSATGKTGEKTRLTINGTDRYATIFGVYIWVSTDGAGDILCDIETSTFGAKTTFTKQVSGALLKGWGGPNYIGFNCTYGGGNSDRYVYSIRFTFSCASYVSGRVGQIGEISLMGSTNWTMPYNLGARGHMYDWDTSQNVAFPAGVSASWFSGSGSSLTSLDASNLASGTVPIARIPTGTSSSTVALGNHTHSQYAATSHNHSAANITSGTLAAARLPTSGVTAGSYGPTANVTGTDNTTINVPQITVDAYGRVTSVTNRVYTSKDTNTTYSLSSFGITATAAELNKLDGVTTTATQFNYLNTLTGNVQTQLNGKASSSHTHNYAGSSSAGGAATSANKLNANAGNASHPVYFSNGVPVAATAYSDAITQGLKVDDSRNDDPAPNSASFTKQALTVDFKFNQVIGSPTGFGGTYCGLLSFAPWSGTHGGNGYQIAVGYNSNAHPRLAIRSADLSATSWGTWYKIYTSDDKPTPAEIGAATSEHTHSNYLTISGTAAAATKLATARTIALSGDVTGSTSFNGTADVTITATVADDSHSHSDSTITSLAASKITGTLPVAHGGTGVTSLIGSSGLLGKLHTTSSDSDSSVSTYICSFSSDWAKGGYIPLNNLRSLIGAAASSHTHSYLPLSGGTLTGYTTFRHTNFSSTVDPSSTVYGSSNIKMETSDSKRCAIFECAKRSSGEYFVTIGASVQTTSGYAPCNISFAAKTSGATSYAVSSAALFRNALGLGNTSGALPVANGGTGTTAKGETLLSNIGITSGTGSAPSSGTNGCIYIQYS